MATKNSNRLPWHGTGVWLSGDPHCHYRLVGLDQLAARAAPYLDFMGITSHGHMSEPFHAQPAFIEKLQNQYPSLILINGVQWEAPLGDSVTILAPGVTKSMPLLDELLNRFDTRIAGIEENQANFIQGLRFLSDHPIDSIPPAVIIQHQHGERTYTTEQITTALDVGAALVGFCVSSAKRQSSPGEGILHPWAAQIDNLADALYNQGRHIAMTAESDFHNSEPGNWGQTEFWPGEYRRTCLYCPEKTEAGIFAGLRSGACYAVVGNLVDNLNLTVTANNETAMLGEQLDVPSGLPITVTATFTKNGNIKSLQLIGNPGSKTHVIAEATDDDLTEKDGKVTWKVNLDATSPNFFVRIKATGIAADPPDAPAALATGVIHINVV